jgi:hypothetical protein
VKALRFWKVIESKAKVLEEWMDWIRKVLMFVGWEFYGFIVAVFMEFIKSSFNLALGRD